MRYVPDLIIRGADDSLVAVIEVKRAGEMSPERAKGIFESYRDAVGGLPPAYFLVVSPERGYLWKKDELRSDSLANMEFNMKDILRKYALRRAALSLAPESSEQQSPRDRLDPNQGPQRGRGLEYVVFHWLLDVATGVRTPETEAEERLRQIGFIDSIWDANVSFGIAA